MIFDESITVPTVDELAVAAMRACRYWKDGAVAGAEMRRECMEVPDDHRADLIEHFLETYP